MSEQNTKMWSGRFREPLDATFESWQRSFPFDYRLLPQEVAASKAHAQAIAAAGILTPAELTTMLEGLEAVRTVTIDHAKTEAEDIHHFVELELTKVIGSLALTVPITALVAASASLGDTELIPARKKIIAYQQPFLTELREMLDGGCK